MSLSTIPELSDDLIDINGNRVLYSTIHLENVGWGIVAKIDRTEVLLPMEPFRINSIISLIIVSITVSLVAIFFSNSLSKPIQKLEKTVKNVAKGNFDSTISIKGDDEIASLGHSFENMTKSLKKNLELEKKLAVSDAKLKTEKLSAIGQLSANIAHDIRNPLAVLKNSFYMLEQSNKNIDEKTQKRYKAINNSIERISHQIDNVLDFVRQSPIQKEQSFLLEIVSKSIGEINSPDKIQINLPENDFTINCDPRKIQIVVTNLILNTIHAIDENTGTINIKIYDDKNSVYLSVEDSGPGIPEEKLEEIFEPLFTTKQRGQD